MIWHFIENFIARATINVTSSLISEYQMHGVSIHLKIIDEKLASMNGNVPMQSSRKDYFKKNNLPFYS